MSLTNELVEGIKKIVSVQLKKILVNHNISRMEVEKIVDEFKRAFDKKETSVSNDDEEDDIKSNAKSTTKGTTKSTTSRTPTGKGGKNANVLGPPKKFCQANIQGKQAIHEVYDRATAEVFSHNVCAKHFAQATIEKLLIANDKITKAEYDELKPRALVLAKKGGKKAEPDSSKTDLTEDTNDNSDDDVNDYSQQSKIIVESKDDGFETEEDEEDSSSDSENKNKNTKEKKDSLPLPGTDKFYFTSNSIVYRISNDSIIIEGKKTSDNKVSKILFKDSDVEFARKNNYSLSKDLTKALEDRQNDSDDE